MRRPSPGPAVASLAARARATHLLVRCLLAATALTTGLAPVAQGARPAPYSAHSMIYTCCTPYELKQRMLAEAKAMGSSFIRLDVEVEPIFEFWGSWREQPDWSGLDQVVALSRRYRLPVVGILRVTPREISTCPEAADPGKCAPSDYGRYASLAARIAVRARGVIRHWEVLNEPDGGWAFEGSPTEYAWMLRRTYDAIKSVAPEDRVLLGGVMGTGARDWLRRVFATPGADARHRFDIANVHLRGRLESLAGRMGRLREFFGACGFRGPTWVTEHGYPGETRFQSDPGYQGGERAQARYLRQSLPTLVHAGADQVFVTLRDGTEAEFGDSEFASEGLLHYEDATPYPVRRKAAFATTRWLAEMWPKVPATVRDLNGWRRLSDEHTRLADHFEQLARDQNRRAGRCRRRAQSAAGTWVRRRYMRCAAARIRQARSAAKHAADHVRAATTLNRLIAGYREGP